MTADVKPVIESDALKANLMETAVSEVEIDPALAVLQAIVDRQRLPT